LKKFAKIDRLWAKLFLPVSLTSNYLGSDFFSFVARVRSLFTICDQATEEEEGGKVRQKATFPITRSSSVASLKLLDVGSS
jgi:hypothetical protein